MAVLATQGHKKLGLTNASDAPHKQLVFVKLTDSSYEALSNYIQNQAKLSKVFLTSASSVEVAGDQPQNLSLQSQQYHRQHGSQQKPTIQFSHNAGVSFEFLKHYKILQT